MRPLSKVETRRGSSPFLRLCIFPPSVFSTFFECLANYVFLPAFNKLKTRNFQCTLFHLIYVLNFENTLDWNNLIFTESDHAQIHNKTMKV